MRATFVVVLDTGQRVVYDGEIVGFDLRQQHEEAGTPQAHDDWAPRLPTGKYKVTFLTTGETPMPVVIHEDAFKPQPLPLPQAQEV